MAGWGNFFAPVQAAAPYPASDVIGSSDLDSDTANASGFNGPYKIVLDEIHHRMYVADTYNSRVLVFNLSNSNQVVDRQADYQLGQATMAQGSTGCIPATATTMCQPRGLALDASRRWLYVADTQNARVLVFDTNNLAAGMAATSVIGQTDFTSNTEGTTATTFKTPSDIAVDDTNDRLFVADFNNFRVLEFAMNPNGTVTDGTADSVLGQDDFTSSTLFGAAADAFGNTNSISINPDGTKLAVADATFGRVLFFDVTSITNGEDAVALVGKPDFTSTTPSCSPYGNSIDGTVVCGQYLGATFDSTHDRIFVNDGINSRTLIFNLDNSDLPVDGTADFVLGQTDFTTGSRSSPSATSFFLQQGTAIDPTQNLLYLADISNNRILTFDVAVITNGEAAVAVLGQTTQDGTPSFTTSLKNNHGPTATSMGYPSDTTVDTTNHRVFVADASFNRVLVYNMDASNNLLDKTADAVLGQTDFTSGQSGSGATKLDCNGGYYCGLAYDSERQLLFVSGTHRVQVFDVAAITNGEAAVHVLGQANFTGTNCSATQETICPQGYGLAFDQVNKRLFVPDEDSYRVLIFDTTAITDGEPATHVLGQEDFSTVDSNHTAADRFNTYYSGLAFDNARQRLYFGDSGNNRVLVFDVAPGQLTNGMDASYVLGQTNFTDDGYSLNPEGLSSPQGLAYDESQKRLFVFEYAARVKAFDVASITNGEAAVGILGQTDFTGDSTDVVISPTKIQSDAIGMGFDPSSQRLYMPQSQLGRVAVFEFAKITSSSLPEGSVGASYNALVATSGTKGTKSFAITGGSLPAGLNLNGTTGAITGTPTSAVNGVFTVTVTDDNGAVGTYTYAKEVTLTVHGLGDGNPSANTSKPTSTSDSQLTTDDSQASSSSSVIEAPGDEPLFLGDEPDFFGTQGAAVEMEIGEQVSLCSGGSSSCSSSERITATLSSINYDAQTVTLTFSPSGQQEILHIQIEKNIDLTKDNKADLTAKLTHLEPNKALINFRLAADIKTSEGTKNQQQNGQTTNGQTNSKMSPLAWTLAGIVALAILASIIRFLKK
ncbi:MAG TPA: putative Ig domain-containing protein [Candidatus Saccharimonadales bacterium]